MAERTLVRHPLRWVALIVVLVTALVVGSGVLSSSSKTQEQRITAIESSLKCPSCQDLSVAQSTSPSSLAIRHQITDEVRAGRSDAEIIASLRGIGARVHLITDGDVAGVINTADPTTRIDMYIGQGGAPEGVLACAALKCVGGQFQGRLVFRNADERARAQSHGITDLNKKYDLHEMVRADAIFVATGVTDGALLDGVRLAGGFVETHTLVMDSATGAVRRIRMKRPA